MAIEDDILKAIKDGFAAQARAGGARGPAGNTEAMAVSTEAVEEANPKVAALREQIQQLRAEMRGMSASSDEFAEAQKKLTEQTRDYNAEIDKTTQALKEAKKAKDKLKSAMKDVYDGVVSVSSKLNEVQKYARDLERTGAASKELSRAAIRLGDDLRLSGVGYDEVTAATKALVANVGDFTMMDQKMQESLIKDASLFAEVGVSNATYTKNLEIATKSLGLSAERGAQAFRDIRKSALAMQIPLDQAMEDFGGVEERLSQMGETGPEVFENLLRIQKITRLDMGKLVAMTDKFDTFEGAAKQVGSLNAALGGNFVDSMSLMMEDDPAVRFEMIRDAIESSGVAVEDMTRKQKMFMAQAAGFENVTDFTRAMSGDLSDLAEEQEGFKAGEQMKTLEDSATLIRSQTELAVNFAQALQPAYGILGTKAMEVTDDLSDNMYKYAQAANEASKKIAELTPAYAAAALGQVESVNMGWEKYSGIVTALGVILGNFGGKLLKLGKGTINFFKNFRKGGSEVTETMKKVTKAKVRYNSAGKVINAQTGRFISPKNLSRMQKLSLFTQRIGTNAANAASRLPSLSGAMTKLGNIGRGIGPALRGVGGGLSRLGGIGAAAIGSVGNMAFESFKGVKKALATEGSDLVDQIGAGILGAGKGAAEAIDYLTFGLLDKLSSMTNSLGMGFNEAWEELDFAAIGEVFEFAFDEAIKGVKNLLGISSPSKVMMDIGMNMLTSLIDPIKGGASMLIEAATSLIEAFLTPWTTIGTLLMEIIQPALDMVPDSIKSIFMGDTAATATNLQTAASPVETAITNATANAATGTGQPQVINISLNLDGKEIDKKVVNLLGGVVKEAIL